MSSPYRSEGRSLPTTLLLHSSPYNSGILTWTMYSPELFKLITHTGGVCIRTRVDVGRLLHKETPWVRTLTSILCALVVSKIGPLVEWSGSVGGFVCWGFWGSDRRKGTRRDTFPGCFRRKGPYGNLGLGRTLTVRRPSSRRPPPT